MLTRAPGLPDDAFRHDGQLTKREVRAVTLSALGPHPGGTLWDIGAGCGSIAIEWMRQSRHASAIAIESDAGRAALISENAATLGAPLLKLVIGRAPEALDGLDRPDAVFIGGGLSNDGVFEAAWRALKTGGRLVANTVTTEASVRAECGSVPSPGRTAILCLLMPEVWVNDAVCQAERTFYLPGVVIRG